MNVIASLVTFFCLMLLLLSWILSYNKLCVQVLYLLGKERDAEDLVKDSIRMLEVWLFSNLSSPAEGFGNLNFLLKSICLPM